MKEISILHVRGPGAESIGYGRLGLQLVSSLSKMGVDVYNHVDEPGRPVAADIPGATSKMTNAVCWVSVPGHARGWFDGQHSSIFTMFETNRLPESYREHMHAFDTIIVPSQQNVELFSRYHNDVRYVPLGVDPGAWSFLPRRPPDPTFRFLIGGSGARKGTDLAYRAFRRVFDTWPKDGPEPWLVMKNPKGEDFYGDRIEMVTGKLSAADEISLYASCHCYVQPSRGEGWGLQPHQALAQGMPTILTDAHGHKAFSHLGMPVPARLAPADYFIYGEPGEWWEPDFDVLCEQMWHVYTDYAAECDRAEYAAKRIAHELTWEHTANRFCDVLDGELAKPYSGSGEWFQPTQELYPVVVLRPWSCEVAGNTYHFRPGIEYAQTADVKRILYEANLLDPSCLEAPGENMGLAPQQVESLGMYRAEHEYCGTCNQRLNSGVTRADALLSELEEAL